MAHPTVNYVQNHAARTAHIAVAPGFYELTIDDQRSTWDRAHHLAAVDGWVPPAEDDLVVVDDEGVERYPLTAFCRVAGRICPGCPR
jgi:hypothetical protein